mmetsp:Transcript_80569/g.160767  ORF Transcript_80569/g.160767 Transcript_80569/m.160767 type:complete len:351 (-) Transcript_80569:194-1246(-)
MMMTTEDDRKKQKNRKTFSMKWGKCCLLLLAMATVGLSEVIIIDDFSAFTAISGCTSAKNSILRMGDCTEASWEYITNSDTVITEVCMTTGPDESSNRPTSDTMKLFMNGLLMVTNFNNLPETNCAYIPANQLSTAANLRVESKSSTTVGHHHMRAHSISLTATETSCFHGNNTVQLEHGPSKRLADLSVGERILTCNTCDTREDFSFNEVAKLPHGLNSEPAAFLTLTIGDKIVDMTYDHYIPRCDGGVVTASELAVGDCLKTIDGKETLLDITASSKPGVYTAITKDVYIVVNGIVASPYSKIISAEKPNFSEQDFKKYSAQNEVWQQYATRKAQARPLRSGAEIGPE